MKVVGIDPGLASTGVGVVTGQGVRIASFSYGCIHTQSHVDLAQRLKEIHDRLLRVLTDEQPDLMIVEDVFSHEKFPRSGIFLGKVAGVILLSAAIHNIPAYEITTREAKEILTGYGNASKIQLEKSVRARLSLTTPIKPDHASDALGLAVVGLQRYNDLYVS